MWGEPVTIGSAGERPQSELDTRNNNVIIQYKEKNKTHNVWSFKYYKNKAIVS